MNKTYMNYALTLIMIVLGVIVLITGLMLWFSYNASKGKLGLYGKTHPYRKIIRIVHLYTALILFGVCIIHFALNIKWFITITKRLSHSKS